MRPVNVYTSALPEKVDDHMLGRYPRASVPIEMVEVAMRALTMVESFRLKTTILSKVSPVMSMYMEGYIWPAVLNQLLADRIPSYSFVLLLEEA